MASFDVIFLGGGPAGYVGAIRSAQLGMNVAVIEREGLGGTCVLWGCIPAKALLEAANLATRVSHAAEFGVTVGDVKLDYGVAMKRSRDVSTKNSKGVEFLFKKNKITWIKGDGHARAEQIGESEDGRWKDGSSQRDQGRGHLHRIARAGPAAGRARAEQDDGDLVGRSADSRQGAQDNRHHRRGRRRLRVCRCVPRLRLEGFSHPSNAPDPSIGRRGFVERSAAQFQEARHRRHGRREADVRESRQGLRHTDGGSPGGQTGNRRGHGACRHRARGERREHRSQRTGRSAHRPWLHQDQREDGDECGKGLYAKSAMSPVRRCSRTRASAKG